MGLGDFMKTLIIIGLLFFLAMNGFFNFDHFHVHWPFNFQFDGVWIEPISSIFFVILAVFAVIAVCVFLAVGIAGIIGASLLVVACALLFSGVAVLWPFLLIGLVIWLLVGERKPVSTRY